MVNHLTVKNCENISHIEVPTEMLHQGEKRQNNTTKEEKNQWIQAKKGKKYHRRQCVGDLKKHVSFTLGVPN